MVITLFNLSCYALWIQSLWITMLARVLVTAQTVTHYETGSSNIYVDEKPNKIGSNVTVFESPSVLAEVNFERDRPTRCRLSAIQQDNSTHKERINELFPERLKIDADTMAAWVVLCGKIEMKVLAEDAFEEVSNLVQHKIFPGTLWCGPGNIAPNYTFLGPSALTDRCCRDHDFCPVCLPPHSHSYGLKDGNEYSVLSCDCDTQLHACLDAAVEAGDPAASWVRSVYFGLYDGICLMRGPLGRLEPKAIREVFGYI